MRGEAIFAPVCALALWTLGVLAMTGYRRIGAVKRRRVSPHAFQLGESPDVPTDVTVANRNLMNLLEMPLLFYVACIALYVTHQVRPGLVATAWLFVGLRMLHSTIHLTSNRIIHRLFAFAVSNLVLLALWLWFVALIAFYPARSA